MSVASSLIFTEYPTNEEYPADGEHPANREYPIRSEILIESIPLIVGIKVTWYVERVIVIEYHALYRVYIFNGSLHLCMRLHLSFHLSSGWDKTMLKEDPHRRENHK